MRVVVAGVPNKGSWEIRANQLGNAYGAKIIPEPSDSDLVGADCVVVVKRFGPELCRALRKWNGPVVYDVVDRWPQPNYTLKTLEDAKKHFWSLASTVNATLMVCATEAMAQDLFNASLPTRVVYHHPDPRLAIVPFREAAQVVAYRGDPRYLGSWEEGLRYACDKLRLRLIVGDNLDLRGADIGLAIRGAPFNSVLEQRYKSNLKAANFMRAGLPFVGAEECGITETTPDAGFIPVRAIHDLQGALSAATNKAWREQAREVLLESVSAISLESCARDMREAIHHAIKTKDRLLNGPRIGSAAG